MITQKKNDMYTCVYTFAVYDIKKTDCWVCSTIPIWNPD